MSARGLGIAAWLLSSVTVAWGLLVACPPKHQRLRAITSEPAHRYLAVSTLALTVAHVLTLLFDPYAQLRVLDVFVPGLAARLPVATALGTTAFLLLLAAAALGASRVGPTSRFWRPVHTAAYAVWPLATAHFVLEGTDTLEPWVLTMGAGVLLTMSILLLRRGWARVVTGWIRVRGASAVPTAASGRNDTATTPDAPLGVPDLEVLSIAKAGSQAVSVPFSRPTPSGPLPRCYSMSSAPQEAALTITVKRVPNGAASTWINDHLRPGHLIRALPPAGGFVIPADATDLTFLAAGSGITPLFSMIKESVSRGGHRIHLLYASADPASAIFREELTALHSHPQVTVDLWYESERGRPTIAAVTAALHFMPNAHLFSCGPAGFVEMVTTAADQLDWPAERRHREEFSSLPFDPFETPTTDAGAVSPLDVELAGARFTVDWPQEQSLIEALVRSGIDAPRSCMAGRCATCACEVVAGEVVTRAESVTDERLADNVVLACQTRPAGTSVRVRF